MRQLQRRGGMRHVPGFDPGGGPTELCRGAAFRGRQKTTRQKRRSRMRCGPTEFCSGAISWRVPWELSTKGTERNEDEEAA